MKTYINTTFVGHYPIGTAVIVTATNRVRAAEKLGKYLSAQHLGQTVESKDMIEIKSDKSYVLMLCDGNY